MFKLVTAMAALLALAVPAGSSAAGSPRWITVPTCTATTTALTCTGRAAGVHPKFISGLSAVATGIQGEIHYTCTDPVFEAFFFGSPLPIPPDWQYLVAPIGDFRNGETFSVEFLPPPNPPGLSNALYCLSGVWTRDPNYYNVRVDVGWGFGSFAPIEALEAFIGSVSAPGGP